MSTLAPSRSVGPLLAGLARTLTAHTLCTGNPALSCLRLPRCGRPERHGQIFGQTLLGAFASHARPTRAGGLLSTSWLTCVLFCPSQRLQQWMYKPYQQMMRDHPHMAHNQPFECVGYLRVRQWTRVNGTDACARFKVKEVNASYHADKVFSVDIPALQHGNDGLIYTCVNTPYAPGTDQNMYVHPFDLS